ncbi:DUF86 domain-containing protein [Variovorax guangxiensis]|uniref:HepT-like ribonuclease domain-containing protein n=1 Tax=Variovorax guangxiensis TaxID=1775474 RepID=UPI0028614A75|nr:DUF86 domain-containing protein [Variovorax guangxiensis]MDR6856605.1 uncharacterized protein with HEPN domain [Variovorax guangxiensis]
MSAPEASRVRSFLQHAVEAIQRVANYTSGLNEAGFLADAMVQDAVIRNIEVMGEAARNVERHDPEFARLHPDIPWKDVYAMRNRVSHGYFTVDLSIVWQAIQRDIPLLGAQLQRLLDDLSAAEGH